MSPKRAMYYVDRLVEAFIDLKPSGKAAFEKNAREYKYKLQKLDDDLRSILTKLPSS